MDAGSTCELIQVKQAYARLTRPEVWRGRGDTESGKELDNTVGSEAGIEKDRETLSI